MPTLYCCCCCCPPRRRCMLCTSRPTSSSFISTPTCVATWPTCSTRLAWPRLSTWTTSRHTTSHHTPRSTPMPSSQSVARTGGRTRGSQRPGRRSLLLLSKAKETCSRVSLRKQGQAVSTPAPVYLEVLAAATVTLSQFNAAGL